VSLRARPGVRCDNCPATTLSSREAAVFGLGWRTWSGTTVGGEQRTVTLCPRCVGDTPGASDPWYGVTCHTCGWSRDRVDAGQPMSRGAAKAAGAAHVCEPDTHVYPVSGAPATVTISPSEPLL
jgi:hypothetical protein